MTQYTKAFLVCAAAIALFLASPRPLRAQQPNAQAQQDTHQSQVARVAKGQEVHLEGVILKKDQDSLEVQSRNTNGDYMVTLTANTKLKEKKSDPFRSARTYMQQQLLPGMTVEVRGRGNDSGNIVADRIRFTNDNLQVAEAIRIQVTPVAQDLAQTNARLKESEQNAQRMSGQIQELSSVANAARSGAKGAQATADNALEAANRGNAGVDSTNMRISNIDDYQVKDSAVVNFKVGSAILSKEAEAELDKIAQDAKNASNYMIEVSGYASSEGPRTLNQALSQRRADHVIQYLTENYDISLRRFVTPMGLGIAHPAANNSTRTGREENRRVEVMILVSKGLSQSSARLHSAGGGH